ncbi:MAG: salicylate hydroxylase [Candidatus Tokpelaia sp. JSC188]|nr:MAG: salicylate hydroxylase [Candidatus Tokpelaia sp. JSC188]
MSVAIALAAKGANVVLLEKSSNFCEIGAGLQLSPNATSILDEWGLLNSLCKYAVRPDKLVLKAGRNGKVLVHMDVQAISQKRWKAPFITIHRSDLQTVLRAAVEKNPLIDFKADHEVISYSSSLDLGFTIKILHNKTIKVITSGMLIGCDGVWSHMRASLSERANFSGYIAWRATMAVEKLSGAFAKLNDPCGITIWMMRGKHFVFYPLRNGKIFNFVAVTHSKNSTSIWSKNKNRRKLILSCKGWNLAIANLIKEITQWTFWPIFKMPFPRFLGPSGEIFLGDASHAITPFAAQGAGMAVEDAAALASALSINTVSRSRALSLFDHERCNRLKDVARRGDFNQLVYHSSGPFAFARNIVMKNRSSEKFLIDLDWLYSYKASEFSQNAK